MIHLNKKGWSIFPTLSKTYEGYKFKQISSFFEDIFSKQRCGFRKGFGTLQYFLPLLPKQKIAADKGKLFVVLLTDSSEGF